MGRALELARRGWGQVAPNPLVGAVIVAGAEVAGEGWHERYGEAHAEVNALRGAGSRARGATMYVSLEPCAHHGRTPPCTDAIIGAGLSRVVVATRDTNPVAGGGLDQLRRAGIAVETGVREADAQELNAAFFFGQTADRPWVTLKMAISLDGAIADGTHTTSRVTGPSARAYAHALRAGHDAIAVGMGTVRIDDPQLTVREAPAPRVPPVRVVFSRTGRLPLTSVLANSLKQGAVIVAAEEIDSSCQQMLEHRGVAVVVRPDLLSMLRELRARGVRSLLVEGGAGLAAGLWEAGLVDRLVLVQAPTIFGAGSLNAFRDFPPRRGEDAPRWPVVSREILGHDIATTYAINGGS